MLLVQKGVLCLDLILWFSHYEVYRITWKCLYHVELVEGGQQREERAKEGRKWSLCTDGQAFWLCWTTLHAYCVIHTPLLPFLLDVTAATLVYDVVTLYWKVRDWISGEKRPWTWILEPRFWMMEVESDSQHSFFSSRHSWKDLIERLGRKTWSNHPVWARGYLLWKTAHWK